MAYIAVHRRWFSVSTVPLLGIRSLDLGKTNDRIPNGLVSVDRGVHLGKLNVRSPAKRSQSNFINLINFQCRE
jgi:hypothetical protein